MRVGPCVDGCDWEEGFVYTYLIYWRRGFVNVGVAWTQTQHVNKLFQSFFCISPCNCSTRAHILPSAPLMYRNLVENLLQNLVQNLLQNLLISAELCVKDF